MTRHIMRKHREADTQELVRVIGQPAEGAAILLPSPAEPWQHSAQARDLTHTQAGSAASAARAYASVSGRISEFAGKPHVAKKRLSPRESV